MQVRSTTPDGVQPSKTPYARTLDTCQCVCDERGGDALVSEWLRGRGKRQMGEIGKRNERASIGQMLGQDVQVWEIGSQ
jgi:hypothetical protein